MTRRDDGFVDSTGVGQFTPPREYVLARRRRLIKFGLLCFVVVILAAAIVFTFSLQFGPWWEDAAFMWEWPHAT